MSTDTSSRPVLPETPPEAVENTKREHVLVEGRTFLIDRPAESDRLLEHPTVRTAWASDDYMPYWADLWPAARMLAKWIVRQRWPAGLHALEVGCGLGLPGITALAMGLKVTFSDYDATAVRFAADNALLNGLTNFETLQMDWRYPPEGMQMRVLLAADLIYETRNVAPLVALVKKVLAPNGVCLLTDQDRIPSNILRDTLTAEGLPFTTQMLRAGEPGGRRQKGTLYRITQPGGVDPLAAGGVKPSTPLLTRPPAMLYNAIAGSIFRQEATMRIVRFGCLSLLILTASLAGQPLGKATLPSISYVDLGKEVRAQKGKVVVVYFWAGYCGPCKAKGVPFMARLQDKYGKDGLVVLSVTLDDPHSVEMRGEAIGCLERHKPSFRSFALDLPPDKHPATLQFGGVPGVFVFNRENRYVTKLPVLDAKGNTIEEFDYAAVEKVVAEQIQKK